MTVWAELACLKVSVQVHTKLQSAPSAISHPAESNLREARKNKKTKLGLIGNGATGSLGVIGD